MVELAASTTGLRTGSGRAVYTTQTDNVRRINASLRNCSGEVSDVFRDQKFDRMKSLADSRPRPTAMPNALSRGERCRAFMLRHRKASRQSSRMLTERISA